MDRDYASRGGYIYGKRDALREVKAMIREMDVFVARTRSAPSTSRCAWAT